MVQRALVGTVGHEFGGADLGDRRRSARLTSIAETLEEQPARGFPRLLGSDAALEAFYRFINNPGFGAEDIVAPHIAATAERAEEAGVVVAVHDTTLVEYSTRRRDLGVTTPTSPASRAGAAGFQRVRTSRLFRNRSAHHGQRAVQPEPEATTHRHRRLDPPRSPRRSPEEQWSTWLADARLGLRKTPNS
jgi:hypothetical protein